MPVLAFLGIKKTQKICQKVNMRVIITTIGFPDNDVRVRKMMTYDNGELGILTTLFNKVGICWSWQALESIHYFIKLHKKWH